MADREELEKEKLQVEINLLTAQLEIEKKKESKWAAWGKRIKNFLPLILTIVAIVGGLWKLYEPISNFVRERQRAYEVNWNAKMIEFVNDLSSKDQFKENSAIIMLSAYEFDALPILLLKLEQTNSTGHEVNLIRKALMDIYGKTSLDKDKFNERILNSARWFFDIGKEKSGDEMEIQVEGLLNYIAILGDFRADNETEIASFFDKIKTDIINYKSIDDVSKDDIINAINDVINEDIE